MKIALQFLIGVLIAAAISAVGAALGYAAMTFTR
jgi:hypothetical protein